MLPMNELAVFAAVVDAGSLSAAARRLGISKAAVSDQVRRLEERLGARLLNRTTRRISLTEAGQACYRHSARMVAEAEAAARSAALFHEEPRGALRIAAPTTFAPMHIVPALPAFLARHPRLSIELSLSAEAVDIIERRFDLAIRIGSLPDSRLVARRLAVSRLIICGSRDYLQRRGTPIVIDDLANHAALEFTPLDWRGSWRLLGPDGSRRRVPIEPVFASDAGEALLAAARDGLGLAALPNWMAASALRTGALVHVLPGWSSQPAPIHAVHAGVGQAAAKIRLFVDHLAAHLAGAAWRA
jgi:DNA-binding transcriptional LysR family regulator